MEGDAGGGGGVGLVDVDAMDGAVVEVRDFCVFVCVGGLLFLCVWDWATDGVVEDEGPGCSGHGFEELVDFLVVLGFDLGVVDEVLFCADAGDELETVAVESIFVFVTGDIVDGDILC